MTKPTPILAAAILAASLGAPAMADTVLRFSHWLPESHALAKEGFAEWMASITEDSGGSITFEVYPAQQLGAAKDHYDMARDGIADFAWVNPGYQPGRFPIVSAPEVPMTVADADEGTRAFDAWYRKYAEKEMSDVKVCIAHINQPGTLHSRKELRTPADLKDMKVRPPNAIIANYVRNSGGVNVQVSAPESREAIEKGTADAIFFPNGQVEPYGLAEVVHYHIDAPLYTQAAVLVMSKYAYQAMSPEEQAVIDSHCTSDWAAEMVKGWNAFEREGWKTLGETDDHVMVELTPEELDAWKGAPREETLATWKSDVKAKRGDADAIWQDFTDTMSTAGVLVK